ncbi:MAG: PA0069 family radical SAM protein [Saprospiraceae bacterium]|nr:PA0069 family radical SAM protein [Saprospiraceae bacterium]
MSNFSPLPVLKGRGSQINPSNPFESTNRSSILVDNSVDDEASAFQTRVIESKASSIVNKVDSIDVPLGWSMNPYQGCEHGCVYCYARNSHNYWGYSSGLDFESNIVVKINAIELLEKKLKSKSWEASPIMLSGNTDCYQPVERHYGITRKLLQCFLKYKHPVGLITKNKLLLRDLDILKELNKDNLVSVAVSINTLDDNFRQKLEPRTSSIDNRLDLIKQLRDNDIPVTALCAPMIPGLNEHEIIPLVQRLAELKVNGIGHIVLRLNGSIGEIFENWLELHYPERKSKVLNKIKDMHGGQLSDSRFIMRMKGEGRIADIIHKQFKVAKQRYHKQIPFSYNLSLYEKQKNPQLSLF